MQKINGEFNCDKKTQELDIKSSIELVRKGKQEAFLDLRNKYDPLLKSQVAKHSFPEMTGQDIEDMRQEALVVFYNAICHFEYSEDGVDFGLYAKICLENGLNSFVRSYLRRRQREVQTLNLELGFVAERNYDPLQSIVDKENMSDMVDQIARLLSDYENRVWWMYVSGMQASEIAQNIGGVDAKSVSNAIYRIRKKLRTVFSEHKID